MRPIICGIVGIMLAMGAVAPDAANAGPALNVYGAASLKEFLQDSESAFEKNHPGVDVRVNLNSSSRLRIQIEQGAPADVFLSANTQCMDPLVEHNLTEDATIFAHNRLVVLTPRSNPAGIDSPGDLAQSSLKLVVAAPETPIGRYTLASINKMDSSGAFGTSFKAKVMSNVCSQEPTVKSVVAKVHLGEADAGISYVSDVSPAINAKVLMIGIPDDYNIVADYPVAVVSGSRAKTIGNAFVRFVLSPEGQKLLQKHGFIPARVQR